tara:strand:+ start:2345 stop:2662 length:318 start_codon:yes stop_codon:yes gene_type:complete
MASFRASLGVQKTGDAQVTTSGNAGRLLSYCIKSGTTDTSVEFRDGGASGTIQWEDGMNGTTAAGEVYKSHTFGAPEGMVFSSDIYVNITGTSAEVCCEYVDTQA